MKNQLTQFAACSRVLLQRLVRLRFLVHYKLLLWCVKTGRLPHKIIDYLSAKRGNIWRIELGYAEANGLKYPMVIRYSKRTGQMPDIGSARSDGPGFLYCWDITRIDA